MSLELSVIAAVLAAALPIWVGKGLTRNATPRQTIVFSILCLIALCFGLIIILGAAVRPSQLATAALPGVVERCLGAAAELLAHPVRHWPRILAALLLVALLARLAYALVATTADFHLIARRVLDPVRQEKTPTGKVLFVRTDEVFAVALRRRIVVSTGAWEKLDPPERTAVLAHERAHLRGLHGVLLFAARVVVRAFPFLPPARLAAQQLLFGLEMAADDAAVAAVGDPMVVAMALEKLAVAPSRPSKGRLHAADSELLLRIARLVPARNHDRMAASVGPAGLSLALVVVLGLLLALPLSARALSVESRDRAVHDVCHLPHPSDTAVPGEVRQPTNYDTV